MACPRLTQADILESLSDRSTGFSIATSPCPVLGLDWLRWPLESQPDRNSNLVEQEDDAKKGERWRGLHAFSYQKVYGCIANLS